MAELALVLTFALKSFHTLGRRPQAMPARCAKAAAAWAPAYRIALQKLHAISTQKLWGSSLPRRESTEAAVFLRAQPHSFHVLLGGTSFAVTITRTHEKGG
jgi:hypothetical protein